MIATINDNIWITVVIAGIAFVCGMWLKARIMSWIGKG